MCNQNYLRLVAGESVLVINVSYYDRHSGRKFILNFSVEEDQFSTRYIEASMSGVKPVRIPHCYIFTKFCPVGLNVKQQNVWKVVRYCFRKEIAFYEAQCEANKEAWRKDLSRELQSQTKDLFKPKQKGEMVVLPLESAISTTLSSSRNQMNLVSEFQSKTTPCVALFESNKKPEKMVSKANQKARGMVLMSGHLTVLNEGVGLFNLPTLEGPMWFSRYMSLGRDAYQLRLEDVPAQHCLYKLFKQEEQLGGKISVWINRDGLMSASVGSPAWHLASYLMDTLQQEPGQRRVAA